MPKFVYDTGLATLAAAILFAFFTFASNRWINKVEAQIEAVKDQYQEKAIKLNQLEDRIEGLTGQMVKANEKLDRLLEKRR